MLQTVWCGSDLSLSIKPANQPASQEELCSVASVFSPQPTLLFWFCSILTSLSSYACQNAGWVNAVCRRTWHRLKQGPHAGESRNRQADHNTWIITISLVGVGVGVGRPYRLREGPYLVHTYISCLVAIAAACASPHSWVWVVAIAIQEPLLAASISLQHYWLCTLSRHCWMGRAKPNQKYFMPVYAKGDEKRRERH